MTGTAAEFQRALRQALGAAVSECAGGLVVEEGDVRLRFALHPEAATPLGVLRVGGLRVEVSVLAGEPAQAAVLLARIDRATLRGGG